MPIVLEASYSKKVGLPGYSSHQYALTLRTEISDLSQVEAQSAQLYSKLQGCVDRDIQQTGFLPTAAGELHRNGNGNGHNHTQTRTTAPAQRNGTAHEASNWKCTNRQRDLVLNIIDEHRLDKRDIEALALERFGKGVKLLNKMEASGLIDELLDTHGQAQRQNGKGVARYGRATSVRS